MNINPKHIIIAICAIYLVICIERALAVKRVDSAPSVDVLKKYIEIDRKIDSLNLKIRNYETEINNNLVDVAGMSNAQRDSLRSVLNPR